MEQPWLFDPGPAGVSERMRDRRRAVAEAIRPEHVRLLGQVAKRLGWCYSTFVRWRRLDPELDVMLRLVLHRKYLGRKRRTRGPRKT